MVLEILDDLTLGRVQFLAAFLRIAVGIKINLLGASALVIIDFKNHIRIGRHRGYANIINIGVITATAKANYHKSDIKISSKILSRDRITEVIRCGSYISSKSLKGAIPVRPIIDIKVETIG